MSSKVGYTGGTAVNPTYREVCTGTTGHAEALQIEYDPSKVKYEDLVEYHFRMHDPTTMNRQGNDTGTQYRSAIFFHTPEQERIAKEVRDLLQATKIKGKIVTEIVPAKVFYPAEDYHQLYLEANPYAAVQPPMPKLRCCAHPRAAHLPRGGSRGRAGWARNGYCNHRERW